MKRFEAGAILIITFLESFGTILLERGAYFYTHAVLGFSELGNLALALSFGIAYALGAVLSHRAARWGERRVLVASLGGLLLAHTLLIVWPTYPVLLVAYPVIGLLHGVKWPLIESYVTAGHTPDETMSVLGRFNVTWALAVPLSVAGSGVFIGSASPQRLFTAAAILNVIALLLCLAIARAPAHLAQDHPERLGRTQLEHYARLLTTSRWVLVASYSLLFLVAPLLPSVFARLHMPTESATAAASLLDIVRVSAFAVFGRYLFWRGRFSPLFASVIALPLGFAFIAFGDHLSLVLLGEVLFGAASGLTYSAALYYAIVVGNASVEAGGAHEALIGLGLALGPFAGIVGHALIAVGLHYAVAMSLGVAPIVLVCTYKAAASARARRTA